MAFDLEEQEKIDQVKAWWNRFGGLVTGILIVILLCIAGYYAWQWYQNSKANQALGYYDIVYASTSKANPDDNDKLRIQEALAVLQKDYVGTAYPARASLVASKYFIQQNDLAAAQQAVQWIIDESKETEILPVARLQLSAILMDQEKFDEAFAQVSKPTEHFVAAFLDRQGDILLAKGDKAGAVKAWKEALNDKDIDQNFVRLIQMKLNVLGGE
ncbi:tetratricopeptide repeat protein [Pelistega sp. NLN82]|uniref:Ancillary SecYEG translocon subunit n=1 Tax=Pelistega ratti TaxID=2652177 RepID=A0A6L9Y460_9BURK|nr:tetratricopeptide repeat protein [Pelistega ratti]NEN75219.1 tetratricopeptide repeat protein [Pelistega ratti]